MKYDDGNENEQTNILLLPFMNAKQLAITIRRGMALSLLLFCSTGSAFYNPQGGRWLNRDPLQEYGFQKEVKQEPNSIEDTCNAYLFVRNSSPSYFDPTGLAFGHPIAYGNWCGPFRYGQGGPPIDDLDAACQAHDNCVPTWREFLNPCKQLTCTLSLCAQALRADCSQSPMPSSCRTARTVLLDACRFYFKAMIPLPGVPP